MKPDFRHELLAGIQHFNARRFWEAHEAWEELWLHAESDAHRFLQGLIQVAAAYHHLQRGTFPGAVRLFEAGLQKVAPFPALYCGIDRDALVTVARQHQRWTQDQLGKGSSVPGARLRDTEYPTIRLTEDWESRVPPPGER
jgi:predicted metal-dependent hydrolase